MATLPGKRPLDPTEGDDKNPRKRCQKPPPEPPQKATVSKLAERGNKAASGNKVSDHILDRIKKCLDRAHHPNTTESEAKAALFLSEKIMSQYNVSRNDLKELSAGSEGDVAGRSTVTITKTGNGSPRVQYEGFTGSAAQAVCTFFNCQCYSTRMFFSIEWSFYGIVENTAAAARAFEMVHNLISRWKLAHKGKSARYSYSIGVARGLQRMAEEEKSREAKKAKEAESQALAERVREEERQRAEEIARLNRDQDIKVEGDVSLESPASIDPVHQDSEYSDDDDEEGVSMEPDFKEEDGIIDLTVDLDEEIARILKREESPRLNLDAIKEEREDSKAPPKREPSPGLWKSEAQLVQFRRTADKAAEEYLKQQGIKLRTASSYSTSVRDRSAYDQGVKDSKNIDIRGNRIGA